MAVPRLLLALLPAATLAAVAPPGDAAVLVQTALAMSETPDEALNDMVDVVDAPTSNEDEDISTDFPEDVPADFPADVDGADAGTPNAGVPPCCQKPSCCGNAKQFAERKQVICAAHVPRCKAVARRMMR